jgi:hypothetical protein
MEEGYRWARVAANRQLNATMRLRMKPWNCMESALFLLGRLLQSGDKQVLGRFETQLLNSLSEVEIFDQLQDISLIQSNVQMFIQPQN